MPHIGARLHALLSRLKRSVAEPVPPELEGCAFCAKLRCTDAEWQSCETRVATAELIRTGDAAALTCLRRAYDEAGAAVPAPWSPSGTRVLYSSGRIEERRSGIRDVWYSEKAEEMAAFYTSIIPYSRVETTTDLPEYTANGSARPVRAVKFILAGQRFLAINAPPDDSFDHAVSLLLNCEDQAEIDRLWDALSEGGRIDRCGRLSDRYGVSWHIVPTVFGEMMNDPDSPRAKRVADAMLKMVKPNLAALQAAYAGKAAS
jgi:predicted 3-demethylubiquinone-9 3-methyltransferase (glyoxalase superfamily)